MYSQLDMKECNTKQSVLLKELTLFPTELTQNQDPQLSNVYTVKKLPANSDCKCTNQQDKHSSNALDMWVNSHESRFGRKHITNAALSPQYINKLSVRPFISQQHTIIMVHYLH